MKSLKNRNRNRNRNRNINRNRNRHNMDGMINTYTEDNAYEASFETNPIILSRSEDGIELDTTDLEIEKIAHKYSKRRDATRTKRLIIIIGALSVISIMMLGSFLHSFVKYRMTRSDHANAKKIPTHAAFTHLKSQFLPGYQASMHHYRHTKTNAEFIAYNPVDKTQDKVFGISFRTKPSSNSGVAHILEHSVLSGSKNYPSKDPFLHLLKGSLHTFLNAMTYNDRTVYPIASRNQKDFQNLMSVYLDAVFFPNCVEEGGEWILKQEGWRYDLVEDSGNENSNTISSEEKKDEATDETRKELEIKGVVYSEMKGVFSDPTSVLYRQTDKFLYPDNTYFYDSGGEPEAIPTLTHQQFVDFYKKHYHPTNSQSFVSGTFEDIEIAMELMDSKYLSQFTANQRIKDDSRITYQQKKFAHHLYQSKPYAVEEETDDEGQHLLLITWLLNDSPMKQVLELSLLVLDYLLIGTTSSPLNKKLRDSGLGTNVIGGGLGPGLLQTTFSVGMKGITRFDVSEVEEMILHTFHDIAKVGFSDDDIKAAINSIEFELREVQSGSNPMGINVFLEILEKWNYDQDPFMALEYEATLSSLKRIVNKQGSKYFVQLIEDYFLKNNHRVHMELRPSDSFEEDTLTAEKMKINNFMNSLSLHNYEKIVSEAKSLEIIHNTDDPPNIVDMIPLLEMKDIDQFGFEYPIEVEENILETQATLVTHKIEGSPGIVYIDVGVDIAAMAFKNVALIPLVITILSECDTKSYSREELDRLIGIHTGGISIDFVLAPINDSGSEESLVQEGTKMRSALFLRGKCTVENVEKMIGLFKEIVENNVLVTQEKVIQLIERKISSYKSSISSQGHSYSAMRMHARYDVQAYIDEQLYGYSQLDSLRSFLDMATNDWDAFELRLSRILGMHSTIKATDTIINVTGDKTALSSAQSSIENFILSLDTEYESQKFDYTRDTHPWISKAKKQMHDKSPLRDEGIVISSRVSYVGKGGSLYSVGEEVSGSSCVPLQYLKKGYLWDEVRAKNGAYGVMAQLDKADGTLFMISYRDPNLLATLDVYDGAGDFLLKELDNDIITPKDITRAIIGCIGAIDGAAVPPRSAGWTSFLRYYMNSSTGRRQRWRNSILNAKSHDFQDFASRLKAMKNMTIAVVGAKSEMQSAAVGSGLTFEFLNAY